MLTSPEVSFKFFALVFHKLIGDLDAILNDLRKGLTSSNELSFGIHGIGGVGKTQLALKYIHQYGDQYDQIIWIVTDLDVKLSATFQDLVGRLGLTEDHNCSAEQSRALVKEWLASETNYLLVFDNAEEPDIVKPYWPNISGTVITTSRNAQFVERRIVARGREIPTLIKEEGFNFLLSQLNEVRDDIVEEEEVMEQELNIREKVAQKVRENDKANAELITEKLGGHPLALSHMASFIQETSLTLDHFIQVYDKYKPQVFKYNTLGAAFDYQLSYASCWALSFSKLRDQPSARILGIVALLDPDKIPEKVLRGYAESESTLIPSLEDTGTYGIAIALLRRRALIQWNKRDRTLSIHRLVQDASIRNLQSTGKLQIAFQDAVQCLSRLYPRQQQGRSMSESYLECRELTPQLLSLERHYTEMRQEPTTDLPTHFTKPEPVETFAELLCHCGWFLYETGNSKIALNVLRTAASICEAIHGTIPNRLTAWIYSNIGVILSMQNQPIPSLEIGLRALKQRRQCLPENDPQIGESLNNCASGYHDMDRLDEAQELFEQSVTLQENAPDLNTNLLEGAYSNLSRNLIAMNRLDEAEIVFQKALSLHKECKDDPFFMSLTIYLVGNLRMYQKRWTEAEVEHQRALDIRLASLGAKHVLTGVSLHQLARLQLLKSTAEGDSIAIKHLRDVLVIFEEDPSEPGLVPR